MTKLQKTNQIIVLLQKIQRKLKEAFKYRHSIPIQIRFSDMDALRHVNNSYHSQYYDVGRINYFEAVMGRTIDWSEILVVIVHIEIDFFAPILQGNNINVESKLISFGNKSMKMHQRLIDISTNQVKSECTTILSGYDKESNQSIQIPQEFKDIFTSYESE